MEEKIRNYVWHQLRYQEKEKRDDLYDEIVQNLIERYHDLLKEMGDEKAAYLETVNAMGDFTDVRIPDEEEHLLPPKYENLAMLLGAVFAGAAFFTLFLHGILGLVFLLASVILFAVGANSAYGKAKQAKVNEKDMATFTSHLKRIYAYVMVCFVFWAGSATFIISAFVMAIYLYVRYGLLYSAILQLEEHPEMYFSVVGSLANIFLMAILVFIVSLLVVGTLSYYLYTKLGEHFEMLTGEENLRGTGALAFLQSGESSYADTAARAFSPRLLAFGSLLFIIGSFFFRIVVRITHIDGTGSVTEGNILFMSARTMLTRGAGLVGLEFLLLTIGGIVTAVLILRGRLQNRFLSILPALSAIVGFYLMGMRQTRSDNVSLTEGSGLAAYYLFGFLFFFLLYVISLVSRGLQKKKAGG